MQKKYSEEFSRQQNLEERCDELKKSLAHVETVCQEQAFGCDALLNKVVAWKKCFEEQKHTEEKNRRTVFLQAQERHQKQMQLREKQLIQSALFPAVVHKARVLLQQKFLESQPKPNLAMLYNERCIDILKDKNSETNTETRKGSY